MKIKCTICEHTEKTDIDFFVKLIGGAMPVGGFWAWTTYLFAGTGFAMAIVVAIIGGGVAMLIYKDEIVEWIINKDYKCPECGAVEWKAVTDAEEKETPNIKSLRAPVSGQKISQATIDLFNDEGEISEAVAEQEESQSKKAPAIELQNRIAIVEALLRSKGYEFETSGAGWIILESSADLKQINTIDELEEYAISL